MAQWKGTDDAANSVSWAAASIGAGSGKAAQAANNTALFGNTTADAFISGQTVGQFGVDVTEAQTTSGIAHPGWVLKRTGSGNRSGRVTYETLVSMATITGDSDGATILNYVLTIDSEPVDDSANVTASESATFSVVAHSTPSGANLAYAWEANSGAGFAAISDGAVYSGSATSELTVDDVTGLDGVQYRVVVSAAGASNATSEAATLTVTS